MGKENRNTGIKNERGLSEGNVRSNVFYTLLCHVFNFFHRSKSKVSSDDFDKRFGFILKYGMDSEKSYNNVKQFYFQNLSTLESNNARCSAKGL